MARSLLLGLVLATAVGCESGAKNAFTYQIDVADYGIGSTIYVDGRAQASGAVMGAAHVYSFVERFASYEEGMKGFVTPIESRDAAMAQIGFVDVKPGACLAECSDAGPGCNPTPITLEKISVTATVQGPVTVDPTMTHCEWMDGTSTGP